MTDTQAAPTPAAGVRRTHGAPNDNPAPAALDICLGERPEAVNCPTCSRRIAGLEKAAYEIETETGETVCVFCLDKTASGRGLRLATLLLNHALEARRAGDHKAALETISAVVNGLELLDEQTPRPAYRKPVRQQPVRQQPVRHSRRGRRR